MKNINGYIIKTGIYILLSFLYFSSLAQAAFEENYWSARVGSLAGAYHAISNDATGVFYNMAATNKIQSKQANFSYARLFAGLDEVTLSLSQFSYLQPMGTGHTLAIGWGSFGSQNLYREDTIITGYSHDLTAYLGEWNGDLSVGVSIRYLMRRFVMDEKTVGDPVFKEGRIQNATTFDLHFYSVPEPDIFPNLSLALSLKSLNQPNIGYKETDRLPKEMVLGLAYQWKNVLFPLDFSLRSNELVPHFGSEISLAKETIFIRSGSDLFQIGFGAGYRRQLTEKFSIIVDYGFMFPLQIEKSAGSHRATVGVGF